MTLVCALAVCAASSHATDAPKPFNKKKLAAAPKNPHDPCPQGMWWHDSHETCTPIICTRIPNDKEVTSHCPLKHHQHKIPIPPGLAEARPVNCVQPYSEENIGRELQPGECDACTVSGHAPKHFGPLSKDSRSKRAISTPAAGAAFSHANCPSDLFAHIPGNGIRAYGCVETCPEGLHPSEPGDFPYKGAKACMK